MATLFLTLKVNLRKIYVGNRKHFSKYLIYNNPIIIDEVVLSFTPPLMKGELYMNKKLNNIFNNSIEMLLKDDRVIGAWHFGSIAEGKADEYSDVDPVFLVEDDRFDEVDKDLPNIIKNVCDEVVLWWPEEFNNDYIKNYAVLVKTNNIYQYDITIIKKSKVRCGMANIFLDGCKENNIIFDKDGELKKIIRCMDKDLPPNIDKTNISRMIEKFWLFVFISIKYFNREDVYKIIYARNELFQIHLEVLKLLDVEKKWSWWAKDMTNNIGVDKREKMLMYFGAPCSEGLKENLINQIQEFSEDARSLCLKNSITYDTKLEKNIIDYVKANI